MAIFKNVQSYLANPASRPAADDKDLMSDIRYIRKSCALITESLQKGCDVMHMPNGDVIITEVRTLTYQYSWDEKKGKMVRLQSGARLRKTKAKQQSLLSDAKPAKVQELADNAVYEEAI